MDALAASDVLRLDINALDYGILAVYFALVITIGLLAKRAIATSEDFFPLGRCSTTRCCDSQRAGMPPCLAAG